MIAPRCRPLSSPWVWVRSCAVTVCAASGLGVRSLRVAERPEGACARARARLGDVYLRGVLLPVGPLRGRYDFTAHLRGSTSAHTEAARIWTPSWCTARSEEHTSE